MKEQIYEFGPLLLGKDKSQTGKESVKKTNSEVLTFTNSGVFDAKMDLAFRSSLKEGVTTPFHVDPDKFELEPGNTMTVKLWAFPEEIG